MCMSYVQFEGQVLLLVVKLLPRLKVATFHMSLQREMLIAAICFVNAAKSHRPGTNQDALSEVCCAVLCCPVQ